MPPKLILLNKPYQVLSQFTDNSGKQTLAEFVDIKSVYPAGRLDYDSEGLLLLTDDADVVDEARRRFAGGRWRWIERARFRGYEGESASSSESVNDG